MLYAGTEKRGGILKPQGSLEKSREEREALLLSSSENDNSSCNTSLSNSSLSSSRSDTLRSKRTRQNVAMQALAKRVEENNKQVTFQTEPIIKTIENQQQKKVETKMLTDISKETPSTTNAINSVSLNPTYQLPSGPTSNDIRSNHSFPNINNSVQLNLTYNQNQHYPRVNVGNIPFPIQYPNNSSNILYHNNIQQQNNLQYPRQQPLNIPSSNTAQPVGYQTLSSKGGISDPFSSWVLDEKLPLPPSAWWSNNQKQLPHRTYTTSQHDNYKQPFPYNVNSANTPMNFIQDSLKPVNMDYNVQYNSSIENTSELNNISVWNTGSNVQSNLQMLFNQPGSSSLQSAQINQSSVTHEINQVQNVVRESTTQVYIYFFIICKCHLNCYYLLK